MNGAHDLGGMHGFGPIDAEPQDLEPVFHAEWEKRAFALTLACASHGRWTLDQTRHARERQHPADYLCNNYYETWMAGLETLLVETGLVTAEELASGTPGAALDPATLKVLPPDSVWPTLRRGASVAMEIDAAPAFKPGDRVRVRNIQTAGHTRAPRYCRGHVGAIETHHGAHIFADKNAHGTKEGQHIYAVRFTARELWGDDRPARDTVSIDLWEPHLDPV